MLHQLSLLLLSLLGSSFFRLAYVVAGAVLLRMLRCVSLSSLRLCCAHVVGGLRTCTPAVGWVCLSALSFLVLPFVLSALLLCSSLSPVLSASASGKTAHKTAPIWGGHRVGLSSICGSVFSQGIFGLYAVGCCRDTSCPCDPVMLCL